MVQFQNWESDMQLAVCHSTTQLIFLKVNAQNPASTSLQQHQRILVHQN
jgi:hypothetical protein